MQGNATPGQWPLKGMKTLILIAPWAQQICGRARFGAKPHAGAGRERNGIIRLYDCSLRPPRAPNRHPAADLSPPRPSFLPRGTHPEPLAHVHRPHDGLEAFTKKLCRRANISRLLEGRGTFVAHRGSFRPLMELRVAPADRCNWGLQMDKAPEGRSVGGLLGWASWSHTWHRFQVSLAFSCASSISLARSSSRTL